VRRVKSLSPRAIFEQDVPAKFLRDWLLGLVLRNQAIREEVATGYSPEAGALVAPQIRRLRHEDALAEIGKRHGGVARWVPNRVESHWHVEVLLGRVVVTQNMVHEEGELPRHADYRDLLVRAPQLAFNFERGLGHVEEEGIEGKVYAQLLHGPPHLKQGVPAFARVAFPYSDTAQSDDYISLNRLLSSLFYRRHEEQIGDFQLERKPVAKDEEDDA
jgi:hypothetical protein